MNERRFMYRVLANEQGELRAAQALPLPVQAFAVGAFDAGELLTTCPVTVFLIEGVERQSGQDVSGELRLAEVSVGTLEEWATLQPLPPLQGKWSGTLEA